MVKIIDVGQTMRAPGLYRVAKDYVIKERVNVNPYTGDLVSGATIRSAHWYVPCSPVGSLKILWLGFGMDWGWRTWSGPRHVCLDLAEFSPR